MAKKALLLLLTVALMLGSVSLTSCNILTLLENGAGTLAPPSGDDPTDEGTPPNINVTGGDTNNITINTGDNATILAASKAMLSVVSITAGFERTYISGWVSKTEEFTQSGSGVIYKLDKERGEAYVITNYHVVHSDLDNSSTKISDNVSLYLYGMESEAYAISAEYIGGSMQYDLAVLKVSANTTLMSSIATAVTVADSNDVAVLDTAIAIGNPDASGISATVGYVNVDSETITLSISDRASAINIRVMRIDTAINGGNSGGGLFNHKGELIGIVNAKKTTSDGMGYAIPSNVAKYVANNVIDAYSGTPVSVKKCIVGLTLTAKELYTSYDEETGRVHRCERVAISDVTETSSAKDLFKVGDVINSVTIDGTKYEVTRIFHATDCMINARVGSEIIYSITRGGENIEVRLTVTKDLMVVLN